MAGSSCGAASAEQTASGRANAGEANLAGAGKIPGIISGTISGTTPWANAALSASSTVATNATAYAEQRYRSDHITRTKLSWAFNRWDESTETYPYDTRYRHCCESCRGLFMWQSRFANLPACHASPDQQTLTEKRLITIRNVLGNRQQRSKLAYNIPYETVGSFGDTQEIDRSGKDKTPVGAWTSRCEGIELRRNAVLGGDPRRVMTDFSSEVIQRCC